MAGRYDNPIPTRFLAPIDCLKIPTQVGEGGRTRWNENLEAGRHMPFLAEGERGGGANFG
jgi:hypothetical protein